MGDHIYRVKELIQCLDDSDQIVKPANFPRKAPGLRWTGDGNGGRKLAVISRSDGIHEARLPLRCNR